jgi:hypothetical protein
MTPADVLRPPSTNDPTANAYKDWLHLNVFDFERGNVAILNASLHGAPDDSRSLAVGVGLVRHPERGWIGEIETGPLADAAVGRAGIGLGNMAIAIARNNVLARERASFAPIEIDLDANPVAHPIDSGERFPFGTGWIGWRAIPRLEVSGRYAIAERPIDLDRSAAYHDHNWGRWFWGDDIGWEWGAFLTPRGPSFVFTVVTNRSHQHRGPATLTLDDGARRRTWTGSQLHLQLSGRLEHLDRRLPGALAALHQDRAHPSLPRSIAVEADDGFDRAVLQIEVESAVQLITADPIARGYSFIHEMVGDFFYRTNIGGRAREGWGLGVFEYVD